jgi:aminomethyltransferase
MSANSKSVSARIFVGAMTMERCSMTAPYSDWMTRTTVSPLRNPHIPGSCVKLGGSMSQSKTARPATERSPSRDILKNVSDADLDSLRYFALTKAKLDDVDVVISRTGYTGDLGYEVWVESGHALKVYDAIMAAGRDFRIQPVGLDAMDITRIEAGYIMNGVDYFSANTCLIESRKSTPYEIGLGWAVDLDRAPFIGQEALKVEKARGSEWASVGLVYDWPAFERLFDEFGLPPELPGGAWRSAIPLYSERGKQVGQATSGAWSAILKDNLALATVKSAYAEPGTVLQIEVTVEYERRRVPAVVTKTPFFDPPRKKA